MLEREPGFNKFKGLLPVPDLAFKLGVLELPHDPRKGWTGPIAQANQIIPGQESIRLNLLLRGVSQEVFHKLVMIEVAVTPQTVEPVQGQVLVKPRKPHEALQS